MELVYVLQAYSDGSARYMACGVRFCATRGGGVHWCEDWGAVAKLVAAGVLVAEPHRGNGTEGHDTYTLAPRFRPAK